MADAIQLSILVAMTRAGVIGRDGRLPWRLSGDLRQFKSLTMGHSIIMGRKTYQSLGRPLPGRTSIVITRQRALAVPQEVLVAQSLDEALGLAGLDDSPFVIGGGEIYALALTCAQRLFVTWVEADIAGDTRFPPWNTGEWQLLREERHQADAKNEYDYTFSTYHRLRQD